MDGNAKAVCAQELEWGAGSDYHGMIRTWITVYPVGVSAGALRQLSPEPRSSGRWMAHVKCATAQWSGS